MIKKAIKAGVKMAMPKGRITPGYKMPNKMKTTTPTVMPKKEIPMPKRKIAPKRQVGQAPAMNWKNKNYKPSNGVGVGM